MSLRGQTAIFAYKKQFYLIFSSVDGKVYAIIVQKEHQCIDKIIILRLVLVLANLNYYKGT